MRIFESTQGPVRIFLHIRCRCALLFEKRCRHFSHLYCRKQDKVKQSAPPPPPNSQKVQRNHLRRRKRTRECGYLSYSAQSPSTHSTAASSCKSLSSPPSSSVRSLVSSASSASASEMQKSIPKNRLGDVSAACSAKFFVDHLD